MLMSFADIRLIAGMREKAIYHNNDFIGVGIGMKLISALMKILTMLNIQTLYTCMALPNPACEALHHKLGFSLLGVFSKAATNWDNGLISPFTAKFWEGFQLIYPSLLR